MNSTRRKERWTKMSRMNKAAEHEAAVAPLWQEHLHAAFPAGLRGADRAGIDMLLLDASVAMVRGKEAELRARGARNRRTARDDLTVGRVVPRDRQRLRRPRDRQVQRILIARKLGLVS
ncbi:hypothetical protein [Streptomyces sp. SD15]